MVLLGKVALGIAGTAVAGLGLICSEGMIEVNVVERQPEAHRVYVLAPAMLVPITTISSPAANWAARLAKFNRRCPPSARGSNNYARART